MDTPKYLNTDLFNADPAAHVFNGKIYIYPSHDIESGVPENDNGDHFNMQDYHVYSMEDISQEKAIDHGVSLDVKDVPWSGRQMWAPDCAEKNGKYYFYFPLKDKNDIFRIGVAIGDSPEGPFKAEPAPIPGSYSIDPAVFKDTDGSHYMTFGGLWGGQLQRFRNNKAIECGKEPADNEAALSGKIVRLSDDMKSFVEEPKDMVILDDSGNPILASDHDRYFFEASKLHMHNGKYYFTYSTGNTHLLCYAIGDNPYGPFTYGGVILTPVIGWTTHHSIIEWKGKSYLFYHDSVKSGGKTWLRNMKVRELKYRKDGSIVTMNGMD